MDENSALRKVTVAAVAAFFLFGGLAIGAMAVMVAFACAMICMGIGGLRGERVWLTLTLITYIAIAVMSWNGITECAAGAPNHCAVGR
jgi:hypothetical protein